MFLVKMFFASVLRLLHFRIQALYSVYALKKWIPCQQNLVNAVILIFTVGNRPYFKHT